MANPRKRIYWDSCVSLSYINAETGRLAILDAILADSASDKGTTEIYTSTVSQVEVAFAKSEQDNKALDPDVEAQIDELWADRSALKLVEFHEAIAKEARQLIRTAIAGGFGLKPMDAIHLATAKWCQAAEFHTYDDHLLKYSDHLGISIVKPCVQQPALDLPTATSD